MMEPANKGQDGTFDDKSQNDMQKLFLLEVLVDNLFIQTDSSSANLSKDLAANMEDTCIMFQFLHYPPLVVCESDFIGTAVSGKDTSHITFKSGKSCFFSLRTPKGPILPVPFDVKVSVIRKMKEGVLPDKLELGKTTIDMGKNFTDLLKQNSEDYCDALPMSEITKGTFDIKDDRGKKVGSLTAFLRISCFGKLIITQFSLNKEDEKKYLFKGTDLKEVCKNDLGTTLPDRGEGQGMQGQGMQGQGIQGQGVQSPGMTERAPRTAYGDQGRTCPPRQPDCPPACRCPDEQGQVPTGQNLVSAGPQTYGRDLARPQGPPPQWKQNQVETFDPQRGPGPTRAGPPTYGNDIVARSPGPLSPWEQSQVQSWGPGQRPGPPTYGPGPTRAGPPIYGPGPTRAGPPTYGNDIVARSPGPLSPWEQSQVQSWGPGQRPGPPTYGPGPTRAGPPTNWPGPTRAGPPTYGNDIVARSPGPLSPWEQSQVQSWGPGQRPGPPTYGPGPTRAGPPTYGANPAPMGAGGSPPRPGGKRLCDCSYPLPPGAMEKFNQQGGGRNMELAPGEVGMQDDQVIFQLPLKKPGDPVSQGEQQDSQVYYKLTSAEETRDGIQKNTVNVKSDDIPGMATKTVSPVSGLPVDDGHDVFLLKIGKKCEGDKKRNLELELRTPKMKEPKPPMNDRDTQYLESDIPKSSKSPKKTSKAGKGKKGSKGGKKGKK